MAITVRSPRGGFSRIAPANDYSNVVSRYADALMSAHESERQSELNLKLLAYEAGNLSYEEYKKFLNEQMKSVPKGTAKEVELTQRVMQADNLEKQRKANFEQQTIEKKRADLTEKYMTGGLTDQEQLKIIEELRKISEPGSEMDRKLIEEQARLLTKVSGAEAGVGEKASRLQAENIIKTEKQDIENIEADYKAGKVSGYQRDRELQLSLGKMGSALESIGEPSGDIRLEEQNATERLNLRTQGQMFDVITQSGVKPATVQQVLNDPLGEYQTGNIYFDNLDGAWHVRGAKDEAFTSKKQAIDFAKANNLSAVNILTGLKTTEMLNIGKDNTFYKPEQPDIKFSSPVEYLKSVEDKKIRELGTSGISGITPLERNVPLPSPKGQPNVGFFESLGNLFTGMKSPIPERGVTPQGGFNTQSPQFTLPEFKFPEFKMPDFASMFSNFKLPTFQPQAGTFPEPKQTTITQPKTQEPSFLDRIRSGVTNIFKQASGL